MSGGSMNYIYNQVSEASEMTHDVEIKELLEDLSRLLYEEEWWKSGDKGENDYLLALAKFKVKWFRGLREERLQRYVDHSLDKMRKDLYTLIGVKE